MFAILISLFKRILDVFYGASKKAIFKFMLNQLSACRIPSEVARSGTAVRVLSPLQGSRIRQLATSALAACILSLLSGLVHYFVIPNLLITNHYLLKWNRISNIQNLISQISKLTSQIFYRYNLII